MMNREADDSEAQNNHQVRWKPWALPLFSGGFLGTTWEAENQQSKVS